MYKTRNRLMLASLALVIAPALALTACSATAPSTSSSSAKPVSLTDVKLLSYSGTAISWIGYIADKKGFFAQNGISAQFTQLPSGQQAASALLGGSVDISIMDPSNTGPLLTQGQNLTLLVNGVKNYWTMVGSKTADPSNLKSEMESLVGQNISAPSVAGSGGRMIHALSDGYGLDRTALTIVADPTNATLTSGTSKAVMTDTIGACRLNALGYKTVFSFATPLEAVSSYPSSVRPLIGLAGLGFWTTPSWASAHPDVVKGFQKAVEETIAWLNDSANTAELASIMRASNFNVADLSDTQWTSCVKTIAATFDPTFTPGDASTWSKLLQSTDKLPALPATSEWFAAGLPQK